MREAVYQQIAGNEISTGTAKACRASRLKGTDLAVVLSAKTWPWFRILESIEDIIATRQDGKKQEIANDLDSLKERT